MSDKEQETRLYDMYREVGELRSSMRGIEKSIHDLNSTIMKMSLKIDQMAHKQDIEDLEEEHRKQIKQLDIRLTLIEDDRAALKNKRKGAMAVIGTLFTGVGVGISYILEIFSQ